LMSILPKTYFWWPKCQLSHFVPAKKTCLYIYIYIYNIITYNDNIFFRKENVTTITEKDSERPIVWS
jgi:hypothetical protein